MTSISKQSIKEIAVSKQIIANLTVGDKVGRLTILEIIPGCSQLKRVRSVICKCDCGSICTENYYSVKYKYTKSCGCFLHEFMKTHGSYRSKEYRSWDGMKQRCFNKNSKGYKNYGGRGITVCDRWLLFANFIDDMGLKPTSNHSIDRINNNGNYEPSNCRWATLHEQAANQRRGKRK
jgi:hypothetical protein